MYILWWMFLSAVAATLPFLLLKQYTLDKKAIWITLAAISYAIVIISYTVLLQDRKVSVVYPTHKMLAVVMVVVAGIALFREKLSPLHGLGIALALLSIVVLWMSDTVDKYSVN